MATSVSLMLYSYLCILVISAPTGLVYVELIQSVFNVVFFARYTSQQSVMICSRLGTAPEDLSVLLLM